MTRVDIIVAFSKHPTKNNHKKLKIVCKKGGNDKFRSYFEIIC